MAEKIGALWDAVDKNGNDYMSGVIGGKKVIIFKNTRKNSDKHPDWNVYPKEDKTSLPPKEDDIPF